MLKTKKNESGFVLKLMEDAYYTTFKKKIGSTIPGI